MNLEQRLFEIQDKKFGEFHASLCPGTENIIGVRGPQLSALAKEIAHGDWRAFLAQPPGKYYEEFVIRAVVIATTPMDIEERLEYVKKFVPLIDNWAVCDAFCTRLKAAKKEQMRVYEFLQPYLSAEREFFLRFGVVMLLSYYVNEEYIDRTLMHLQSIKHDAYYVKMAVAWALSVCYVKFPERTMPLLQKGVLEEWVRRKSIQKCCESLRVSKEDKELLKKLR